MTISPRVLVRLNGEQTAVSEGSTVASFVQQLGLQGRRIAVEVNREILARDFYEQRILADGDEIEIVHFVGGG